MTEVKLPVHHQIAADLRERILSGELRQGSKVPTIAALAEQWDCSAGSVRSALALLREEGRLTAGRGAAARVRHSPERTPLVLSTEWSQIQHDLVLKPEAERARMGAIELTAGVPVEDTDLTARYRRIHADNELGSEFGLPVGTELMRREYEMTAKASGLRISSSVSYIPLQLIDANPALLDETTEPWPGGHQHQLYTVGIEVTRFVRQVIAIQPTPSDRQLWGMEQGTPMLCVRSKSIDADGRVVELSDATYPADRTKITFSENLRPWTPEQLAEAKP